MKAKVLFVTNDAVTYGSTRSMLNLIDELQKKNIAVSVLIPSEGPLEQELQKRNLEYKIGNYYTGVIPKEENGKIKLCIKMILNYFKALKISKWVKNKNIDIVHSVNSATFMGYYISKINKISHIWHIREMMQEDHNLEFFNKKIAYSMFDTANYKIYVSKSVENKYKKILSNKNSKVIYNGIPNQKFINITMPNLLDKYKLLIAGNICKTKGQEDAIKAIEYLKQNSINNLELQIAGDGIMQSQLETYVKKKNLQENVKFLGFRDDLDEIRKNINIYLMCSKNEAFGRVTIESMMSKNLVIGANTGGTKELIKDNETGFLYNQGDYIDLANKIKFAIENWDKSKEIIENAYIDAMENYSIKRCADEVYNIYQDVLKEK